MWISSSPLDRHGTPRHRRDDLVKNCRVHANRIQSIEVVVRILSNEKEVEKLSRDDVTFLKHELFGPVLGSTAGVAASA